MNEPPEPSAAELQELLSLVEEANHVGSSAAAMSAERLRKCVQVGALLLKWKQSIPRGQWQTWLDQHLPDDLNDRTRRRWMQLAQLDAEGRLDLESARGLRHAYQLAQLLPEGDSTGTKQSSNKPAYIVHLSRLLTALGLIKPEDLTTEERNTMKERLAPLLEYEARL